MLLRGRCHGWCRWVAKNGLRVQLHVLLMHDGLGLAYQGLRMDTSTFVELSDLSISDGIIRCNEGDVMVSFRVQALGDTGQTLYVNCIELDVCTI